MSKLSSKDLGKKFNLFEMLKSNQNDIQSCYSITLNEKKFKGGSFEYEALNFTFTFCPFRSVSMRQDIGNEIESDSTQLGKIIPSK
jgi:hypothetical protein